MKTIWISRGGESYRWQGRWAGMLVRSSTPLPGLEEGQSNTAPVEPQAQSMPTAQAMGDLSCGSIVTALFASQTSHLTVLTVPEFGLEATLEHQSGSATWSGDPESIATVPFLTGPVALLLLAWQGQFTWHASAIAPERGPAVLLCGASGSGKSTLARYATRMGWRRLSDDLTAMAGGTTPRIPGGLPQLKLKTPLMETPPTPIGAIVVLDPQMGSPKLHPMTVNRAVTELVRHTVAARLFAGPLLARHLAVAAQLAGHAHLRRLVYHQVPPHIEPCLATIASLLAVRAVTP